MIEYAVLMNPGHNRVYFKSSAALAVSELTVAAQKISVPLTGIGLRQIAGIEYLAFSASDGLTAGDIRILSGLSFVYALFEIAALNGGEYLKPIQKNAGYYIDEGISSILKYTGKTNEIFTRMMLNVAYYTYIARGGDKRGGDAAASTAENGGSSIFSGSIKLLDPVAGKGTTLYEGLVKGFDVYGVEIGDKIAAEAYHFMKKYLETEKLKHSSETLKISGPNKSFTSVKYAFDIARTKEEHKADKIKHFEIIAGNSVNIKAFYKKGFFDIIVGDLPYGVQHGSVTNQKQSGLTRNPAELLDSCLPAWVEVLKPGSVIALSWNVNVLARADIEMLFARSGLSVMNEPAYLGFGHRVDQAIVRDLIVAVK